MASRIHPTALIDSVARLGDRVVVGPYAVVEADVTVGEGTEIGAGAQIQGSTRIGSGNKIFPYACIGFDPQDLKYKGEKSQLKIGDRNVFREFSTIHRGTAGGGGVTTIGSDNLFMAYTHVAHDCHVGDRTVFSNAATLAGHVSVEDDAVIGAFSAVHQFCRVGRHAYIGGFSVITRDALPFVKTVGQKPACYGLNTIGLRRKGFGEDILRELDKAVRLLLRSGLTTAEVLERLRAQRTGSADVDYLIDFVAGTERGVISNLPGSLKTRGGSGDSGE